MLVCSNKMNRHMEPSGETSHMHITIHPIVLKLDDENYNNSDHMPGRWERKRERREYNVESWKGQETVDDATSQKYQILFGESNLRCMLYLIWKSAIFHIEVTEKKKMIPGNYTGYQTINFIQTLWSIEGFHFVHLLFDKVFFYVIYNHLLKENISQQCLCKFKDFFQVNCTSVACSVC